MTELMQRRLARLKNRTTLYELEIVRLDGQRRLVAYCARKTAIGVYDAINQERAKAICKFAGDDQITYGKTCLIGNCIIAFSGRTQRDCYIGGELDYICDEVTL